MTKCLHFIGLTFSYIPSRILDFSLTRIASFFSRLLRCERKKNCCFVVKRVMTCRNTKRVYIILSHPKACLNRSTFGVCICKAENMLLYIFPVLYSIVRRRFYLYSYHTAIPSLFMFFFLLLLCFASRRHFVAILSTTF